jgi:hypothetical protein
MGCDVKALNCKKYQKFLQHNKNLGFDPEKNQTEKNGNIWKHCGNILG